MMKQVTVWLAALTALVAVGTARADEPPASAAASPPSAAAPATPAPATAAPAPPRPAEPRPPDRLELDPTSIRANQELPKVLYIVPWKQPGLAEPAGRPLNSLVDEVLAPVDRDVFRRQMRYYDQLYAPSGASQHE